VLNNGDLASGSWDKTIKIWNATDGTLKRTLYGHTDYVYALAALNNGDLASGSRDSTIKIWNPVDGALKRNISSGATALTVL
jgi:WD40 repeat protein